MTTKDRIPAEQNAWYQLLNWHGVPNNPNDQTHQNNRLFWLRLMFLRIDKALLENLRENEFRNDNSFKPFSNDKIAGIKTNLIGRLADFKRPLDGEALRFIDKTDAPHIVIECGNLVGIKLILNNFIFPFHLSFTRSKFNEVVLDDCVFCDEFDFSVPEIDGRTSFINSNFWREVEFGGKGSVMKANFENCEFRDTVTFRDLKFIRETNFINCKFRNLAQFDNTSFEGSADFSSTTFYKRVVFRGNAENHPSEFKNTADFRDVKFKGPSDFSGRKFSSVPMFQGSELHMSTLMDDIDWPEIPANKDEAKKTELAWITLTLLMNRLMRHSDELDFFSRALEARNKYEGFNLFYWCYRLFSDFGQSTIRPTLWLLGFLILFWVIYYNNIYYVIDNEYGYAIMPNKCDMFWKSGLTSLINAIPFVGLQKYIYQEASVALLALGALQTFLSTFFLFLIGLGIRNKFRIK